MHHFSKIIVGVTSWTQSLPTQAALELAESLSDSVLPCSYESHVSMAGGSEGARSVLREGAREVAETLIEYAEEKCADLIMVGTRSAVRGRRVLLGPTAMDLIRIAPVPVWCVKPGRIGLETTIAVAVDLHDPNAGTLLDWGVEVAIHQNAGLLVIHAIDRSDEYVIRKEKRTQEKKRVLIPRSPLTEEDFQNARGELVNLLAMTDQGAVPGGVRPYVKEGRPDDVILDALDKFDVDLLIMSREQYDDVDSQFSVGSVAGSVLPQVRCSVLVSPPQRSSEETTTRHD